MRSKLLLTLVVGLFVFAFTFPVLAQISTKSGSVYGKVVDDKGAPLPGVSITLESSVTQPQTATSGPTGGFRFANLPPGRYSATFSLEGFTEVRQEDVQVNVGGSVQLEITLKPTLAEEFVVVAETPVVDTKKTGNDTTFSREYLDKVPSGRDPWVMIEQTPGVDNDRINVAGSESGQQTGFFARGASDADNGWNYDGVNATDPLALGASPTYYDFDAFEEIQIQSGGNDASIAAKGVTVNLVTKRAGNKWEANASYYFTNDSLQGDNTPDEVKNLPPINGVEQQKSNRIDQIYDYGLDVGGPIVKDKFFVWGAYRRNQIDLFTRTINPFTGNSLQDKTTLKDYNFKANFNANSANESQFGYFDGKKEKQGRGFNPPVQAEETLWNQGSPGTILEGIWTGQHTYIPNDHTILNARYGYIGLSFNLVPKGGDCAPGKPCAVPMIYLAAIPHFEQTSYNVNPIDRPSHDFNVDMNWFKENWAHGDHEFKFGFEYKQSKGHTFSSYGNGELIIDYYQTTPGGPLTSGYLYAQHFIDGTVKFNRSSFYATDTWRANRLTMNLGFRVDSDSGSNDPSSIPGIPGLEAYIGPLDFPGNDFSKRFTNVSPRLGATYDLTGDGKTILRGNYARYYDGYVPFYDQYRNPTYVYNGVTLFYNNTNGDRDVSPSEITGVNYYYGGLNGPIFDLQAFYDARKLTDLTAPVTDEVVLGFEREVVKDLSLSVSWTYRDYKNFVQDDPFGVTSPDQFHQAGVVHFSNPKYGTFDVPYSDLNFVHDGSHILHNVDGYSQTYSGVDFGVRKRMSNNFMLNGFVTLQRQKAHYNGGDSFLVVTGDGISLRTVYADPLLVSLYDDKPYAFVSGGSGKTGVFPYAEWAFRMSGVYQLPWDMSTGAFVRYQQGYPQELFAQVSAGNLSAFYAAGKLIPLTPVGDIRYDNIFTLDLNLQKVFTLSNYGRITLAMDVFNVTNSNEVVQRERRTTTATFDALQENLSPRAFRFGFKYSF